MKTKECKECGGIMEQNRNMDNQPVWKCRCCYVEIPRRINNCKKRNEKQAILNDTFKRLLAGTL